MLSPSQSFRIPLARREESLSISNAPASPPLPWAGEKLVLHKLRFHPDFVAPFSPPCEGGGRAGVVPARPVTRSSHALSLSVLSHPSREARRTVFAFQGSRITPPAPPSQGGERDRSLATPFHRAQQKHASQNRPSSSVNTNFSSPHPCPPFARGGKGSFARDVISSRTTKTRVSKSSLQLSQHQLFTGPLGDSRSQRTGGSEDPARTSGTNPIGKKTRVNRNFEESGRYGLGMGALGLPAATSPAKRAILDDRRVDPGKWGFFQSLGRPVIIGEFPVGALDRGMLSGRE